MGRYVLMHDSDSLLGEGSTCVCHEGFDVQTYKQVAIKIYKVDQDKPEKFNSVYHKFRRHIDVLQELMAPLSPPSDSTLWCEQLAQVAPSDIFVELFDYSKDANGQPARDPTDGHLYVVTELAECSLKDFIKERREGGSKMSQETVRHMAKAVMVVAAGLHAHGFVHLDLKPENLMIADRKLKLVDVDGCLQIGSKASVWDGTLSFSPIYCAPEWANLLLARADMAVTPQLDVWSIGMTLCELVTYRPVLSATFANLYNGARSHEEGTGHFLDWLRGIPGPPIPRDIWQFDPKLYELLQDNLLVVNPAARKSLADSLSHPYFVDVGTPRQSRKSSCPLAHDVDSSREGSHLQVGTRVPRALGASADCEVIHTGILWRLEPGAEGDREKEQKWVRRDAWLGKNGSLCLGAGEGDELVLIEGPELAISVVSRLDSEAARPAMEVVVIQDQDRDIVVEPEESLRRAAASSLLRRNCPGTKASSCSSANSNTYTFGCESEEDREAWLQAFGVAQRVMAQSVRLSARIAYTRQQGTPQRVAAAELATGATQVDRARARL